MNIQTARINARNCLSLSFKFQELSPAAQKFLGAIGGTIPEIPKNWIGCWLKKLLKKTLCWRLDKLILMKDPSVRVMTLEAMDIANYRSRHLGLIATLYCSEESGDKLGRKGEKMSSERLDMQVWRYMLDILEIPSYFDELQKCATHWEGVLRIDYTEEFSTEGYRDTSGEKPIFRQRKVSPEEVRCRIKENKSEVRGFYRHALNKLLEKKLSGYYEQRPIEVYRCLDEIFAYLFRNKFSDELRGAVLEMLADIAKTGRFPERWLLELSKKHVI